MVAGMYLDVANPLAVLQNGRLDHCRVSLGHRRKILGADMCGDAGLVTDGDDGSRADSIYQRSCETEATRQSRTATGDTNTA